MHLPVRVAALLRELVPRLGLGQQLRHRALGQAQHVLREQPLPDVVHRQQLAHAPADVQRVEVGVGVFVHVVAQHLLQPRLHRVALGDERVPEAADERAGRQRAHVLREPVGAVLLEAERARRGQRQRRGPVVVVVRRVVVERRWRARPLLATCGESTVTREHEEGGRGTGGWGARTPVAAFAYGFAVGVFQVRILIRRPAGARLRAIVSRIERGGGGNVDSSYSAA